MKPVVTWAAAGAAGASFAAGTASEVAVGTGVAASGSNNVVVLSYIDEDQRVDDLYWTITKLGKADSDNLLESNEKFQITIGSTTAGSGAGNLIDALTTDLSINKKFMIEVKPPIGAVLNIERTTPAFVDTIMNLH